MGGGNLLHLAEHFFFYVFLVIRADVVPIQPLLSFVLLFILFLLCRFDFPSPLLFPLAIHYAGPFFFSFFLTLSSTLCIIIIGLFCFDMYALVDRGLFTFSLLFYCYYYLASCCLVVLSDSFSIL